MLLIWSYLFFTLGQVALQSASQIASAPRPTGTQENKRAADMVATTMANCGLSPQRHAFSLVEAPGVEALGNHFLSPMEAHFEGQNIWARVGPKDAPAILVGAHYDSASIRAPGARDNAAGVGVMLAVACAMKELWRGNHSLVFVAFDGEEAHLLGSRAFLRDKPAGEISLVLSLDILGSDNLSLNGLSPLVGLSLGKAALSAADEANVQISTPFAQLVISRFLPQGERSDHGPFTAAGIPAFQLYSRGEYGFDPYYHSEKDNAQRLSEKDLDDAARWIVAFLPKADVAISSNESGRFFPVGGFLMPGWAMSFFMGLSLLMALAAVLLAVRRNTQRASWPGIIGSFSLWVLLSLVLAAGFFLPFLIGRWVHGVSLPWLSSIAWYTLSGALLLFSLALSFASSKLLLGYLEGAERFFFLALLSLCAALLFFWSTGAVEAAAPFIFSLFFVALGGFFTKRGRLSSLGAVLIGASLLSPWRYVEGVLAWTLAGGSWLYFVVFWFAVLVFGAAALGARPIELSTRSPKPWMLAVSWLLSLIVCLVAVSQDAYHSGILRRTKAELIYQDSSATAIVSGLYGEGVEGLSLQINGTTHALSGEFASLSIPYKEVGIFSSKATPLKDGTEAFLLEVEPKEDFVEVIFRYKAKDQDGRPAPFQYRTEQGEWKEVTSPLGLRVGFYGFPGKVQDERAFQVAPGAVMHVTMSAALREVPEDISFVEQERHLPEIEAFFEVRRPLLK